MAFRPSARRPLVALAVAGLLVAACGDDDAETAAEPGDAAATTAPAGPRTVAVTAVDYGYGGLPPQVPAGTTFTLTNDSEAELHELVAFRLPDEEKRAAAELVRLPEEELGRLFAGEPATVLLAPPGGGAQIAAVGDGTLADPGRYLVFCAIPTGADPEEYLSAPPSDGPPQVAGGPPHFTKGMHAEVVVG